MEKQYVWVYDSGYVVDPETGEVVDVIYDYTPYEGNNEVTFTIGTHNLEDKIVEKASRIQKKLAERGFVDVHGTYVNYVLGLTNKTVKSLKRTKTKAPLPFDDEEFAKEVRRWLTKLEKEVKTIVISTKTKNAIACALAVRSLGRDLSISKIAKLYEVDEKYLRRTLTRVTKKLLPYMLR